MVKVKSVCFFLLVDFSLFFWGGQSFICSKFEVHMVEQSAES